MTVATADERVVRLHVEYPDVAQFLAAYWPADETDDATALHTILRTECAGDVSQWRRRILLFLLSAADDADKATFIRAAARRCFRTERPAESVEWLGAIALALLDIEDHLAPHPGAGSINGRRADGLSAGEAVAHGPSRRR